MAGRGSTRLLDVPPPTYDAEACVLGGADGWEPRPPRPDVEFARLTPPPGILPSLLLQRPARTMPAVRAHLDRCAADRDAEVERHVAAGATSIRRYDRG